MKNESTFIKKLRSFRNKYLSRATNEVTFSDLVTRWFLIAFTIWGVLFLTFPYVSRLIPNFWMTERPLFVKYYLYPLISLVFPLVCCLCIELWREYRRRR